MKLFKNQKKCEWIVATTIIIGIVASVVIIGFFIWKAIKLSDNQTINTLKSTDTDTISGNIEQVDTNDCDKNTIRDFGEAKEGANIFVYTTRCFLDVTSLNESTIFYQFYVRDFEGTFNKEIYSVLSTPSFKRGSGIVINDPRKDTIGIYGINEDGETIAIDSLGNNIPEGSVDYQRRFYDSPDKRITASIDHSDLRGVATLTVVNNESNKKYIFDDFKQSLNSIRYGGWSIDGKTLYITGGIYEFSAPAKLWSINVDSGQISEYDNLNGYSYPVYIFPEDNLAYFTDAEPNFESKNRDVSLYKMNLDSRKIEKVYTDNALSTFGDLKLIGDSLYYRASYENNSQVIVKLNDNKKEIFLENVNDLKLGTGPRFVAAVKNGYFVFDLEKGLSELIETPARYDGAPIIDKTEYFHNIAGIIEPY